MRPGCPRPARRPVGSLFHGCGSSAVSGWAWGGWFLRGARYQPGPPGPRRLPRRCHIAVVLATAMSHRGGCRQLAPRDGREVRDGCAGRAAGRPGDSPGPDGRRPLTRKEPHPCSIDPPRHQGCRRLRVTGATSGPGPHPCFIVPAGSRPRRLWRRAFAGNVPGSASELARWYHLSHAKGAHRVERGSAERSCWPG